jgi:hypothetical protein
VASVTVPPARTTWGAIDAKSNRLPWSDFARVARRSPSRRRRLKPADVGILTETSFTAVGSITPIFGGARILVRAAKSTAGTSRDRAPVDRRVTFAAAIVVAALFVLALAASQRVAHAATPDTGFVQPYAGTPRYLKYAPREATRVGQVNRPLGAKAADRVARKLGLNKRHAFTPKQYRLFISGRGIGGDPAAARLVDESVRIFTNTTGRPLLANVDGTVTPIVLGSYGLMVSRAGMLESLANTDAPTRQVNSVLVPGGYLGEWCRRNGAEKSLWMLYRSAYGSEVLFGNASQQQSGVAQLVPNQKGATSSTVGMSMAPSIWIVNFAAVYTLKPSLAAKMPAWWTPIPDDVVQALEASPTGQVPFSEFASSFPG